MKKKILLICLLLLLAAKGAMADTTLIAPQAWLCTDDFLGETVVCSQGEQIIDVTLAPGTMVNKTENFCTARVTCEGEYSNTTGCPIYTNTTTTIVGNASGFCGVDATIKGGEKYEKYSDACDIEISCQETIIENVIEKCDTEIPVEMNIEIENETIHFYFPKPGGEISHVQFPVGYASEFSFTEMVGCPFYSNNTVTEVNFTYEQCAEYLPQLLPYSYFDAFLAYTDTIQLSYGELERANNRRSECSDSYDGVLREWIMCRTTLNNTETFLNECKEIKSVCAFELQNEKGLAPIYWISIIILSIALTISLLYNFRGKGDIL